MGLRTCALISHSPIDKLIYQIYQLVGSFPANLLSSCISQNIFFHIIGNKELPFHFLKLGRFQYWSLPLTYLVKLDPGIRITFNKEKGRPRINFIIVDAS